MNPVGIMQGRLSPPDPRRLQAFPWRSWEPEFEHAAALGFDCIEWLFESERFEENPVWTAVGRASITRRIRETGVGILSVCADYFIPHPFFRVPPAERERSIEVLRRLLACAADVGAKTVLLPVLEESEVREETEAEALADALGRLADAAAASGVLIGLETELPADRYAALAARVRSPWIGVYYDTGNTAARGFRAGDDLALLGRQLVGLHLKDRKVGGGTVMLGQGDADFAGCFREAAATSFAGPFILQPPFGPDFLGDAARNRTFVLSAAAPFFLNPKP